VTREKRVEVFIRVVLVGRKDLVLLRLEFRPQNRLVVKLFFVVSLRSIERVFLAPVSTLLLLIVVRSRFEVKLRELVLPLAIVRVVGTSKDVVVLAVRAKLEGAERGSGGRGGGTGEGRGGTATLARVGGGSANGGSGGGRGCAGGSC
jgi:uncharacterized membrane protein YgcG